MKKKDLYSDEKVELRAVGFVLLNRFLGVLCLDLLFLPLVM